MLVRTAYMEQGDWKLGLVFENGLHKKANVGTWWTQNYLPYWLYVLMCSLKIQNENLVHLRCFGWA